jgi:hypothetical protein
MENLRKHTGAFEEILLLALALAALAGSFILQPNASGGLSVPIAFTEKQMALPEVCMSHRVLGISCPGCGLTRSFVCIAHGDPLAAFRWNPMGPVLFIIVLFQIPYRAIRYVGLWRSRPFWVRLNNGLGASVWPVCGGLIALWLVRLVWPAG